MFPIVKLAALLGGLTLAFFAGRTFLPATPVSTGPAATTPIGPSAPTKGFAVVELFTSEGCSSCPPADQLVARIQQEDKEQPVYILAYHVDYWDRLGWKDAFSDARYSSRQKTYTGWLKIRSAYTPQIV